MLVYKDGITIEICERDLVQYKNAGYVEAIEKATIEVVVEEPKEAEAKPKTKKK